MRRDLPTLAEYQHRIERTIAACKRHERETETPMGVGRLRDLIALASRAKLMGRAHELRERLARRGYTASGHVRKEGMSCK